MNWNPSAPVIVTEELMAAWALMADEEAQRIRLGKANWAMIVRSLIAEVKILRTTQSP